MDVTGILTIDESGIESIEYSSLPHFNVNFSGIVSEALYSDDYDIGIRDHEFLERKIHFPIGARLKVEVYLLNEVDVSLFLNAKEYHPISIRMEKVTNSKGIMNEIYTYLFKPVTFYESGVLSFKINK